MIAEARALASRPTRQLGNWSLEVICQHLATAMDLSIKGEDAFPVPLMTRILARIYRNRILNTRLPSGFKLPPDAVKVLFRPPQNIDSAIAAMEQAISDLARTSQRQPHPVFGSLSVAQWDKFHLRHAELHLSFIEPSDGVA